MADKQATIYVIDQGRSMGDRHNDRDESDLDYGMRYIWDKITTTLLASRATWTVGVVGLRTDRTDNELEEDESYSHISITQPLGSMKMRDLKLLQHAIQVSKTEAGDAISAIIVAIEMIMKFTRNAKGEPLKYARKIILMTNGRGAMDADDIEEVAKKLNEDNIDLVVVGIDFDDAEYGFKEEDKDFVKSSNEALLKSLTDQCKNGVFGTAREAIEDTFVPRAKQTRPYKTYAGQLTLGDPAKYETAMCIDVERYFRTHKATPPPASNFVVRTDLSNEEAIVDSPVDGAENGLTAVKISRTYIVNDHSAPGGKRDVDRDELARGYEYGRTAVHIAESDENVAKLESVQSFTIVGFIPQEKYERFFNMGSSGVTVAQRTNEKAILALSSLVHALHELSSYAVARIVVKDGKDPQLLLLAPSIEPDLESLIDVPLPFAEDVRQYRFPPLDRVVTLSGNTLTTHRNIPTEDLSNAMSAYVDSMDISEFGRDDEGNLSEYMPIDNTYSPTIHRLSQAIKRRAVKLNEPVQPPAEILIKYSHPPAGLLSSSKKQLTKLIAAANVKRVPPKAKGKRGRDTIKPLSGLDVEALLGREKRQKITTDNSIPEFKQMLDTADDLSVIEEASKQMGAIIRSLITHSLGDSGYGRAIENLVVMREELINMEEPGLYNDFIIDLKKKLLIGELGGNRRDMLWEIRKVKLGLVDKKTSEISDVTEEEAIEFYSMKNDLAHRSK